MKHWTRLLPATLALCALTSCEALTGVAPEGTPRVEVELLVNVEGEFLSTLEDADADLVDELKKAVRDKADLGLRFYPTPSEMYGANDRRPPYLMTVDLDSLVVYFEHDMVEVEGQETRIMTHIDEIGCGVSAILERRRQNGPPLMVASANSTSRVRAERDPDAVEAQSGYTPRYDGARTKLLESDLLDAVDAAVTKALKSMRLPIDREFGDQADVD